MKLNQDKYNQFDLSLRNLFSNFKRLSVRIHCTSSIFGFFVILSIISQLISGTLLSFSLIPEPMLIPVIRDEEDIEVPYIDLIFWIHERGVDILFILFYYHLFRKLYLFILYIDQEYTWKSGIILLSVFQVVTFLGLVLCCTHLSDITLSIACNIMHTFFNFIGQPYAWFFTDKKLCSDTIVRLAYAHYVSAFLLFYLGLSHSVCMHYDWKSDENFDSIQIELIWFDEVLSNELSSYVDILLLLYVFGLLFFSGPEPLSYEVFMWGDVGLMNDIRFYGVAPHWYFRPFMSWLTICPFHKTGIFGILIFFFFLYNQISIKNRSVSYNQTTFRLSHAKSNQTCTNQYCLSWKLFYWLFIMSFLYTFTFLPAGRYYQVVYGNNGAILAYFYILLFLSTPKLSFSNNLLCVIPSLYQEFFLPNKKS